MRVRVSSTRLPPRSLRGRPLKRPRERVALRTAWRPPSSLHGRYVMHGYNLTDRLRKVLQMAREEAHRRGHEHVDTGHLLLAIIGEAESTGAKALERLGVDIEIGRASCRERV